MLLGFFLKSNLKIWLFRMFKKLYKLSNLKKKLCFQNLNNLILLTYKTLNKKIMFKKFTITDKLLFVASFLSLIFSEILYFQGQKEDGTFIGIWVPSILAFGIYLKLINNSKND